MGDECSPVVWKIGYTLDTFHRFGKDFSVNQWLNNFARIRDSSRLIFLRPTTGILSVPVAFLESRLLISLETSWAVMKILLRLCPVGSWKENGFFYLIFEFKAKIKAKSFTLSVEEDMTSGD